MTIQLGKSGRRINESHPRAKLTDHEVDLILRLWHEGLGYRKIAKKFDVRWQTVQKIIKGKRRVQVPMKLAHRN